MNFTQKNILKLLMLLTCTLAGFSLFAQDANFDAAKNHLKNRSEKLRLSKGDLENMSLSSGYVSPTTGWYHAYFTQNYDNIEVYNGILNVALKDGHVIHIGNKFIPEIAEQLNSYSSSLKNLTSLTPETAITIAAKKLGLGEVSQKSISPISVKSNVKGEPTEFKFTEKSLSNEPISVKKYWFKNEQKVNNKTVENIALVWNVLLETKDQSHVWNVQVDVNSGEVLAVTDGVISCNFGHSHPNKNVAAECKNAASLEKITPAESQIIVAPNSYRVFDYPVESPIHGSRTLVSSPYTKFAPLGTGPGSTNGWHDNGSVSYIDTRGNNVLAQEDTNDDDSGGNRPVSATLDFDFPYTQGLNTAAANQNAAITNLFYWNNLVHDVLWKIGFDEPSGNFQTNNLSRGGLGNDAVIADAQDGDGLNNANFRTPPDGQTPRMQMYLFDVPSTYEADSDFDNGIIAHEYGHGWSIRLTAGANNVFCLENLEQGGEGWSDYLGLMLTTNWGGLTPTVASANIPRGIGTYVMGEPVTGDGIRPYRYSYDMATINPLVTYAAVSNTSFSAPHGIGSIWCTMLWDMTWEIILQDNAIEADMHNTANMIGNVAALKLVNEGLRLQPCNPSFVDARDAILAADQAFFAGKYRCAIGKAFARRGLGLNATTGSSSNDRLVTQDFAPIAGNSLSSLLATTICTGESFNYVATSNTAGTTFSWNRVAVAGISNSASSGTNQINEILTNTTSAPIVVEYVFSLSPSGCGLSGAVQQPVRVTVNPAAVAPTVGIYTINLNQNVPAGEGLKMGIPVPTNSVNSELTSQSPSFIRPGRSGGIFYYKQISYVAQGSGNVTFEITTGSFDTFLFLYDSNFNPLTPNNGLLASNDDLGFPILLSRLTHALVQGQTYNIVVSSFDPQEVGDFTITSTVAGFTNPFNWYTVAAGGNSIFTGNTFNPVGVTGSGIPNTATPLTKNYFVAAASNPSCRTTTTFIVSLPEISTDPTGFVTASDTVCAIFNSGTLTLNAYSGTVIGWESSDDHFATSTYFASSSPTFSYAGLLKTTKFRAVIDQGSYNVATSKEATIFVTTPVQILTNTAIAETTLNRASLTISSNQKLDNQSKISYEAGRNIELNTGFEATNGSVFSAEIFMNDCYIPVQLTLQPNAATGKDTDISSLFVNNSYGSSKYIVPSAWTQFGNQEIRRTLIEFDLSSIPTNAVIDSAFLWLSFSDTFIQENPPFTGHFGDNILEIKRIEQPWAAATATWTNQPTVSENNKVVVTAAAGQTANYTKLNIKNLINDQLTNGNNGLMIRHQTESPFRITCLASCEDTTESKRPKLVIYYRYL